jgi:hypothetical protein
LKIVTSVPVLPVQLAYNISSFRFQFIDFSPGEKYLVTFSQMVDSRSAASEEPSAIIIWETRTGVKKRAFHAENAHIWFVDISSEKILGQFLAANFGLFREFWTNFHPKKILGYFIKPQKIILEKIEFDRIRFCSEIMAVLGQIFSSFQFYSNFYPIVTCLQNTIK